MPKFCANLTMLYGEHPFLERFAAARADGFDAVEFMFPYPFPKEQVADALQRNGLRLVLHNLPAGDWEAGERGVASHPGREGEFQDGVGRAIEYAQALDCPQVNCLVGIPPEGADPEQVHRAVVDNLRFAADALKQAGIRLLIEPVNNFDIPGFWLRSADQAVGVMDEVSTDNLFLQYDLYHQQRTDGELLASWRRLRDQIAHVQVADNPGRGEPGTGEVNYPFLFESLDREGYTGWIGCEYKPRGGTSAGLDWLKPYRRAEATSYAGAGATSYAGAGATNYVGTEATNHVGAEATGYAGAVVQIA